MTTASDTVPVIAVIYCRISSDPEGTALGVARQREDCQRLADSKGWTVAATFIDNDVSAFSGKDRPGYRAMLDLVRSGGCSAILAWHPDRLHRSPRELEDFIPLVEAHGVTVETVRAGRHDFTTANGRMMARITGSVARAESEVKSERVRRALAQRAEKGRPHGRVAYGWRRVGGRDVADPGQAAIVAEISGRIISGDSLRSIAMDLTRRGEQTPRDVEVTRKAAAAGKVNLRKDTCTWLPFHVRTLALRERCAGLLVRHGEPIPLVRDGEAVQDADGGVLNVTGDWDPLISVEDFNQVKLILSDPRRKTSTGTVARHLLSGLAKCAVCGGPMRVAMRVYGRVNTHKVPVYRCLPNACVSRRQRHLDDYVTKLVIARLSRPDAADLLVVESGPEVAEAVAEATRLRARLEGAALDYADGKITSRQLELVTSRLLPRITAAEAASRVVDDSPLLVGLVGAPDVGAVWESLPLSRRRAVVDLLMGIRVERSSRHSFDPATITVSWKAAG